MFERSIHCQVLQVLQALSADFLTECEIYFGGGTLLALSYGEYRLSRDIDFLCLYGGAFSQLRGALYTHGYEALFDRTRLGSIQLPGELRTDRYGVRFPVQLGKTILKVEIVAEGRIELDAPLYPGWSPVPCLSVVDQVAEKLLANSDRWVDTSTDSRDLIDLAILRLKTEFPQRAIDKAESAYRCIDPLKRSILNFQAKPDYRARCYERLSVASPAMIMDGLDQLAVQFELPVSDRIREENSPLSSE
jgi:Nucleotidyl transferase AbiEii toxin, Type IV TA system